MMSRGYLLAKRIVSKKDAITYVADMNVSIFDNSFNTEAKLDLGCNFTNMPVKSMIKGLNDFDIDTFKSKCINSNCIPRISFGVSDTNEVKNKIMNHFKNKEYGKCGIALSYELSDISLTLNGYAIKSNIRINFNRDNNILIGADILDRLYFIKGKSKILNDNVIIVYLKINRIKMIFILNYINILVYCKIQKI